MQCVCTGKQILCISAQRKWNLCNWYLTFSFSALQFKGNPRANFDVSLAVVSQGNTLAVASEIIDPIMSAYPNLSAITNNTLPASSTPYRQVTFPILAEPRQEVQGIQGSTIGQSTNTVEMNIHRWKLAFRECIGYFKDGAIMDKFPLVQSLSLQKINKWSIFLFYSNCVIVLNFW